MKREDLLALDFYKYLPFNGSENGLRFRVEKFEDETGENNKSTKLKVTVWPEPLSFECTEESLKKSTLFDYSEEGLYACSDWINSNLTHPLP